MWVNIKGNVVELDFNHHYSNGRLAIAGTCANGSPWGALTVNIVAVDLKPNELIVDVNKPFGYEKILKDAGLIGSEPARMVHSDWVDYPVYEMTPLLIELAGLEGKV